MLILTFLKNVFSNFWLIFGKLWEARSRLDRSRTFATTNTRLKALDEIYKISNLKTMKSASGTRQPAEKHSPFYTTPISKIQLTFAKHFRMFARLPSKFNSFLKLLSKFHQFGLFFWNFSNFLGKKSKYPRFSNFLRFRKEFSRRFFSKKKVPEFSESDFQRVSS